MAQQLTITGDGSHSLYVEELDEHYHSRHGAVQESLHVFIEHGFNYVDSRNIRVLEMGFGTGLNAMLTWLNVIDKKVDYVAIEKYPLEEAIWQKLNYPELVEPASAVEKFARLHEARWEAPEGLSPQFTITKIRQDFRRFTVEGVFDVIYFDAFAPDIQPNLWSDEILRHMYDLTREGGVLVTYSAKGDVRRGLQKVGYAVERLEGPPGKKHMTRAIKK